MSGLSLRLTGIKIENFKNVGNGSIDFVTNKTNGKSSICGIYGQNGSGKTAVVNALQLLREAMLGGSINKGFINLINTGCEYSSFVFSFRMNDEEGDYNIDYEVKLGKKQSILRGEDSSSFPDLVPALYDEILSYSFKGKNSKIVKNTLISTSTNDDNVAFLPETKYKTFFGDDKAAKAYLVFNRKVICHSSGSFVFSRELFGELEKHANTTIEYVNCYKILDNLIYYARANMFVIGTYNSAAITSNKLPLYIKSNEKEKLASGLIYFNLDTNTVISEKQYKVIKESIKKMNIVLKEIVPGLKIGIKDIGTTRSQSGEMERMVSIESFKCGEPIPLRYESEGIKKIISILQLLIAVYNQKNVTVVIDELDSGVFEYLLGEILRIISEKGEGQLIFSSHNLRPLETIDKNSIVFTTTNPQNRFIRFTNVKSNNNLRDFYYRDIIINDQSEEIYAKTNNAEIAMAFREAGESDGT